MTDGSLLADAADHYAIVWLGFAVAAIPLLLRVRRPRPPTLPRPASDATWFVPVYLWGLASVHRSLTWVNDVCVPNPVYLGEQVLHCFAMLAIVLGLCFLAERCARRVGAPVRAAPATLPLSVVAAILSVTACWAVWFVLAQPLPEGYAK